MVNNCLALISKPRVIGIVWLCLWLCILGFGLWPFTFWPANRVQWLETCSGIHFDRFRQAYSERSWNPVFSSLTHGDSFTIEIWLRAEETGHSQASEIFSIDDADKSGAFAIIQSVSDLSVRGQFRDEGGKVAFHRLWLDDVLRRTELRFITICSGPQGSALYIDGIFQQRYPLTLTPENFSGRLLLGHDSADHQPWSGDLLGLAIYARELSANEVSEHYRDWQEGKTADLVNLKGISALYTFDEHGGDLIHERAGFAPNLLIPKRFKALHKEILYHHFDPRNPDWNDIIVNIVGFVPFGFVACATLLATKFSKISAVGLAILLGCVTSLAIELLQVYLPSRDSSLLDLIDNTVGTAIGAMLFAWIVRAASPHRTSSKGAS